MALALLATPALAFGVDDVHEAISEAAANRGVSAAYLSAIIRCETGGTFNPYSRGRAGELGPVQLKPGGMLPIFYAWGYDDPDDPYQAVDFLANQILLGNAHYWSCA